MRIKLGQVKQTVELTKENYEAFAEETAVLGQGICAIKTNVDPKDTVVRSHVKGFSDGYTYLYFLTDLSTRMNEKTWLLDGKRYVLMMTGEAPLTVNEDTIKELPVLNIEDFNPKTDNGPHVDYDGDYDYNAIAKTYVDKYKYTKYNDDVFYFDNDKFMWQPLRNYDDYNILISKVEKGYLKKDKQQIMDSMQIYLYDLENVQIDKNLLLFKNNKVLNIITKEATTFDGSQFVINRMNANWYEDGQYPDKDIYLSKVLKDICGININANMRESEQRHKDLLIYLGYMLTDMEKQSGIILYGKAQNGKSTVARLISKVKGSAFNINVRSLLVDPHYTAGFYNDRILFIDELKPSMITEEFVSKYNQLLGNRNHSIRPMQKEPRNVITNFAMIVTANEISNQFFTNRALLRRTKVMNSMFPVVTNLPPNINLDDEVQKQDNMDWLANHCIRAFMANNYDISKLFNYDIKKWLASQNPTVTEFMQFLVDVGLVDVNHNIIGKEEEFKRKLSMLRTLKDELIFRGEYDWTSFDEQINIAFQFIFHMTELSCLNGIIRWTIGKDDLKDEDEE